MSTDSPAPDSGDTTRKTRLTNVGRGRVDEAVAQFCVYLQRQDSLATIDEWLAQRAPELRLRVRLMMVAGTTIAADLDELRERANARVAPRLAFATQRVVLESVATPTDYGELARVFDALAAIPGAIGVYVSTTGHRLELYFGEAQSPVCIIDRDRQTPADLQ